MPRFDANDAVWTASKWRETFRFENGDMARLCAALDLPEVMRANCRTTCSSFDGPCIVLCHLSYPSRVKDIVDLFGRPKLELSVVFNGTIQFLYQRRGSHFTEVLKPFLKPERLEA